MVKQQHPKRFSLGISWKSVLLSFLVGFSLYWSRKLTAKYSPVKKHSNIKWEDFKRSSITENLSLGDLKSDWHQFSLQGTESGVDSSSFDPCEALPGHGEEGNKGFQALYKVDIPTQRYNSSKILCVLYNATSDDSIRAAYDVYGRRCDKFLAATTSPSTVTTTMFEGIDSSTILSIEEGDWANLLRIFKYVDDFDILHIATERTLVVAENLRKLVARFRSANTRPLYFGGPALFADDPKRRYCSPGAGYSLSRLAVDMVLECEPNMAIVNPHERLADCLHRREVECATTMDQNSLRYLEFGAEYTAKWRKRSPGPVRFRELGQYHGMHHDILVWGISKSMVGLHMVDGEMPLNTTTSYANVMRRFDAIVRKSCEATWSERIPHGAVDENGKLGYIHDATYVRKNPLQLNLAPDHDNETCMYEMGTSVEGPDGLQGLQKIEVQDVQSSIRVMCLIYTHSGSHKERIEAIAETYGQRCDGFMAASNLTDRRIGAVNILHEGPEVYGNMWLKVRAIWKYVYEHYLDDFDIFHIGGDDMYVIPENLRQLVASGSINGPWNQSAPLYLGTAFGDSRGPLYFCGGGAGYTLNRPALKLLIEELFPTSACSPHLMTPEEDRKIGDCFRPAQIFCANTQDADGEDRYHHMDADFHVRWKEGKPTPWRYATVARVAGVHAKDHLGQISKSSVSFHLKDAKPRHFSDRGMRRYDSIIHGHCRRNHTGRS